MNPTLFDSVGGGLHELGIAEGRRRRDKGFANLDKALHLEPWWGNALRVIKARVRVGWQVCSDDVHRLAGSPPRKNAMGRLFAYALEEGLIEDRGDWTPSERPEARGRVIRLWSPGPASKEAS